MASRLLPANTAAFLPSTDVLAALLCVLLTLLIWTKKVTRAPHLHDIFFYPVKSCAGCQVESACITARGLEHDRMLQCSSALTGKVCTPRDDECARLFHVSPIIDSQGMLTLSSPFVDGALSVDLNTMRTTERLCGLISALGPEAVRLKLEDYGDDVASWLEAATGIQGARLTGMPDKCERPMVVNPNQQEPLPKERAAPMSLADEAPFLLCSVESLRDLNRRLAARGQPPVDMRRFRPNLVIAGLRPWEEDTIERVRIGGVPFDVWQRCGRCKMTTIDRDTLEHGPEPLATLSTFRERAHGQRNFGVHLVLAADVPAGTFIARGAAVEIVSYNEERRAEWQRTS
jgi:uncharacterized protein YcbX